MSELDSTKASSSAADKPDSHTYTFLDLFASWQLSKRTVVYMVANLHLNLCYAKYYFIILYFQY